MLASQPASQVSDCCDIFLRITLTCALPTQHPPKKQEAKKVGSLVVIKQSAQNNLHTILPCGLKSFGSSLSMSNSYVWLLTESSSETLIQRNAWESALALLTWQGNVSSLNSSRQFGLVIVINPPSLHFTCGWRINNFEWMGKLENILCKDSFCVNQWRRWHYFCVSVSVFFSGEISQNIWPQKHKGSLYSVSWKIFANFVRIFFSWMGILITFQHTF